MKKPLNQPPRVRLATPSKPKSRVQSATRALRLLEYLNSYPGLSLAELAHVFSFSRGTAYRLLETLCDEGYVERDTATGGYKLGHRVRSLSDGYADEQWLKDYALDRLYALAADVKWPLKLATLHGFEMLVRASTDSRSPFAQSRTYAGHRVPLLRSAAGLVYLAFSHDDQRRLLMDMVKHSSPHTADINELNSPGWTKRFKDIARDGYAFVGDAKLSMVAVPVVTKGGVFAAIAMQFFTKALRREHVRADYVPLLQSAAQDIAAGLEKSNSR
jgi:IclR family mhp operon transcriptional activator